MARPLTATMQRAMRNSHQVVSHVDFVQDDSILLTTRETESGRRVRVVDGDVSWDVSRELRGQCNLQLILDSATVDLIPTSLTAPLSPVSKTLIRVSHGFRTTDGNGNTVEELVQLGEFDPADVDIDEGGGGIALSITAYDKTRRIRRDRFTDVYTIAAGTNYVTAASALIQRSYPDVVIVASPTFWTTGLLAFDIEGDALKALYDLMDSIGFEVLFGSEGEAIIRPITEPTDDPQWTIIDGESDTKMTRLNRKLTDEKTYNGVVVRGESFSSGSAPVTGEAWDLDPDSPTYYDPLFPSRSTYGPVPYFYVSEFIYNSAQATDAAAARLPKVKGLVERTSITTRINPGIEINDVMQLERGRIGLSGPQVVESVSFGLKASTMQIGTRERRLQ